MTLGYKEAKITPLGPPSPDFVEDWFSLAPDTNFLFRRQREPTLKYPSLLSIESFIPKMPKLYRWGDYEFNDFKNSIIGPVIDQIASYPIQYISPTQLEDTDKEIVKLEIISVKDQTEWFNRMIYRWRYPLRELQSLSS